MATWGLYHQEALESGWRNRSLAITPNLTWLSPATREVISQSPLLTSATATGGILSPCHPGKAPYGYGHRFPTDTWAPHSYGHGLPIGRGTGSPRLLALLPPSLPPWGFTR